MCNKVYVCSNSSISFPPSNSKPHISVLDHLHENFLSVGVPKESHLIAPVGGKIKTKSLYGKVPSFTSLEMPSIIRHCCDLIGVGIGSSDMVRTNSFQVQKRFKTLMVTLQRLAPGDSVNLFNYNAGPAINWIYLGLVHLCLQC